MAFHLSYHPSGKYLIVESGKTVSENQFIDIGRRDELRDIKGFIKMMNIISQVFDNQIQFSVTEVQAFFNIHFMENWSDNVSLNIHEPGSF